MATPTTLEDRVARLERDMANLIHRFANAAEREDWITRVAGSLAESAEFDEVVRLGREFREGQTYELEQQRRAERE